MSTNSEKRGFLRSALDAVIAGRERQAQLVLQRTLLSFDDETLAARGYSRANLLRGLLSRGS